jgi:hypothetical protein
MATGEIIKHQSVVKPTDYGHRHQSELLLAGCVPDLQVFLGVGVQGSQALEVYGWDAGAGAGV